MTGVTKQSLIYSRWVQWPHMIYHYDHYDSGFPCDNMAPALMWLPWQPALYLTYIYMNFPFKSVWNTYVWVCQGFSGVQLCNWVPHFMGSLYKIQSGIFTCHIPLWPIWLWLSMWQYGTWHSSGYHGNQHWIGIYSPEFPILMCLIHFGLHV